MIPAPGTVISVVRILDTEQAQELALGAVVVVSVCSLAIEMRFCVCGVLVSMNLLHTVSANQGNLVLKKSKCRRLRKAAARSHFTDLKVSLIGAKVKCELMALCNL